MFAALSDLRLIPYQIEEQIDSSHCSTAGSKEESRMINTNMVELDQVVSKVHAECLDATSYKIHQAQGTLDEHYMNILTAAVADMASLPVTRLTRGLEPIDDPAEVSQTFSALVKILCIAFGKTYKHVEADLADALQRFPTQDYRLAAMLRNRNKLH